MKRTQTLLCAAAVGLICGFVLSPIDGAETGYVDFYPGKLNIILTAPHGGDIQPLNIPDRDFGCYIDQKCVWTHDCGEKDTSRCKATTVTDLNTWALALELRQALYDKYGAYPYTIISKLKRTKLDPNRERDEASFNVTDAARAWDEFHGYIDQAKAEVSEKGQGILFDLHGHGMKEQWAMLGYLIRGGDLEDGTFTLEQTSIVSLVESQGRQHFEAILRGAASFGAYMMAEGFDAVPSLVNPDPNGASFYSGGYITRRHGSRDGGKIDAIQIESANSFRTDRFDDYVEALAAAIHGYVGRYYPTQAETDVSDLSIKSAGFVNRCWALSLLMLMSTLTILLFF